MSYALIGYWWHDPERVALGRRSRSSPPGPPTSGSTSPPVRPSRARADRLADLAALPDWPVIRPVAGPDRRRDRAWRRSASRRSCRSGSGCRGRWPGPSPVSRAAALGDDGRRRGVPAAADAAAARRDRVGRGAGGVGRRGDRAAARRRRVAQRDLKQLLAASTCAQIGFMVLAAGRRRRCRAAPRSWSRTPRSRACCSSWRGVAGGARHRGPDRAARGRPAVPGGRCHASRSARWPWPGCRRCRCGLTKDARARGAVRAARRCTWSAWSPARCSRPPTPPRPWWSSGGPSTRPPVTTPHAAGQRRRVGVARSACRCRCSRWAAAVLGLLVLAARTVPRRRRAGCSGPLSGGRGAAAAVALRPSGRGRRARLARPASRRLRRSRLPAARGGSLVGWLRSGDGRPSPWCARP